jgi:hypothetical protein
MTRLFQPQQECGFILIKNNKDNWQLSLSHELSDSDLQKTG